MLVGSITHATRTAKPVRTRLEHGSGSMPCAKLPRVKNCFLITRCRSRAARLKSSRNSTVACAARKIAAVLCWPCRSAGQLLQIKAEQFRKQVRRGRRRGMAQAEYADLRRWKRYVEWCQAAGLRAD